MFIKIIFNDLSLINDICSLLADVAKTFYGPNFVQKHV